jgi:GNAT superfamily N-acetyltransferase
MLYWRLKPRSQLATFRKTWLLSVDEFLQSESDVTTFMEWTATFRSRSEFLRIWRTVGWLVVSRRGDVGSLLDGVLCVSRADDALWHVDYVFVRPERRGKGIGTSLLIGAINAVIDTNEEITLRSRDELQPFYERLGFEIVRRAAP